MSFVPGDSVARIQRSFGVCIGLTANTALSRAGGAAGYNRVGSNERIVQGAREQMEGRARDSSKPICTNEPCYQCLETVLSPRTWRCYWHPGTDILQHRGLPWTTKNDPA